METDNWRKISVNCICKFPNVSCPTFFEIYIAKTLQSNFYVLWGYSSYKISTSFFYFALIVMKGLRILWWSSQVKISHKYATVITHAFRFNGDFERRLKPRVELTSVALCFLLKLAEWKCSKSVMSAQNVWKTLIL